jgi:hypothetical protein
VEPAEEIVGLWLQQQGFFVMRGIRTKGGKEIDFLAINLEGKRVHVESHVSVFPLGPLRPWGPARYGKKPLEWRVEQYYKKKFVGRVKEKTGRLLDRCIEEKAKEKLGGEYEKWLVLGKVTDDVDQLKREFEKHGVKVFLFENILKNIRFEGAARGIGRTLQLLAATLTPEAQTSLLGNWKKQSPSGGFWAER